MKNEEQTQRTEKEVQYSIERQILILLIKFFLKF